VKEEKDEAEEGNPVVVGIDEGKPVVVNPANDTVIVSVKSEVN